MLAALALSQFETFDSTAQAKRNLRAAIERVSARLGNTPTICRKSYIHPIVVARYIDEGDTIALPAARRAASDRGQAHSPEERALIAFLDRHFPERRRKPRHEDDEDERRAA